MKRLTIHILSLCAAIAIAVAAAGCQPDDRSDTPADTAGETLLTLRVCRADAVSRAAPAEAPIEEAGALRVIITRPDGSVEVNHRADFAGMDEYTGLFRLIPGEDKTLYAIANPEGCGFDFDAYPAGSRGIADALEEHEFEIDLSKRLVMTDRCRVAAASLLPGQQAQVTLNVVKAAVKFTVEVTNTRDEALTLTGFTINGAARRQYLLPRFTGDGRDIVNEDGAAGWDFDRATGLRWSEWLRMAVDESRANPTDATLADRRGWIMKYAVPSAAGHAPLALSIPAEATMAANGGTLRLDAAYAAESRDGLVAGSTFGRGAAAGHEQSYTYEISFRSRDGGDRVFSAQPFPNLRALFRNTHVVLKVTARQNRVESEVRVVPYAAVTLEPGFGWDSLPDHDELPDPDLS